MADQRTFAVPTVPDSRENRQLLDSQKVELLEYLGALGFNRSEFEFVVVDSRQAERASVTQLRHGPSLYSFTFDWHEARDDVGIPMGRRPYILFSPGKDSRTVALPLRQWGEVMVGVERWLECLAREIGARSQLDELLGEVHSLVPDSEFVEANSSFTAAEKVTLFAELDRVKCMLTASAANNAEALYRIERDVTYLRDAAKRIGRKDWILVAISLLVPLGIEWLQRQDLRGALQALVRMISQSTLPP